MDEDGLAVRFEEQRPHLRAVAYRMLGSHAEADDAVQNAWLRLSGADTAGVANLAGWLTTVVARECLNMLRARRNRREEPLPDVTAEPAAEAHDAGDPEAEALLADSIGPALMVVLDGLAPAERLAFVLHDVFAVPFGEIADIVGRSPPPPVSSPAGPADGSWARPRPGRWTSPGSGGSWTPSSPRCGMVTSTGCSPCSIPMSCSGTATRSRCGVREPWAPMRSPSRVPPGSYGPHWWTAPLASRSSRKDASSGRWPSPSITTRSPRSR